MNPTPTPTTPIVSPVLALLRSRKFMALQVALLVDVIVALVPAFEPVQEQLITVVSALFGALILGIAHEDHGKPAPGTTSTSVKMEAETVSSANTPAPNSNGGAHG